MSPFPGLMPCGDRSFQRIVFLGTFDFGYVSPMTLDQLRIFLCVAELAHVTRAAERLHLTQSAVSAAIAALERQHDVKLFDRVGRGIALTEAGALLVEAAGRVLAEAGAAHALLADLSAHPRGRLRIWASQTVAGAWLTPRLMRFHEAAPQVAFSLHPGNTREVAEAVLAGEADLGFVEGEPPPGPLTRRLVGHDELVLVLPRAHPVARRPRLTAEDYRGMRWLLREPGSGTRETAERHFAAMGLTVADLSVTLELPTSEAILHGVRAGGGAALLSWRSAALTRRGGIAMRRIGWAPRPRRDFLALSDPRRHETRAMAGLLAQLAPMRQAITKRHGA